MTLKAHCIWVSEYRKSAQEKKTLEFVTVARSKRWKKGGAGQSKRKAGEGGGGCEPFLVEEYVSINLKGTLGPRG